MFDHCRDLLDNNGCRACVWQTLHCVACACHPCQGGRQEDAQAVFDEARGLLCLLGESWPEEWPRPPALPNLFDVYCKASGLPNPFGSTIAAKTAATATAWEPQGFDATEPAFGAVRGTPGRAWLLALGVKGQHVRVNPRPREHLPLPLAGVPLPLPLQPRGAAGVPACDA